jgi:hypothetical protein
VKFVAKKRPETKIEVVFPDETVKEFAIVQRNIETARNAQVLFKKMQTANSEDPKESMKALDDMLKFLFPGASLKDFEKLDMDDLVSLLQQMQGYLEGLQDRPQDEKKNQSN